MQENLSKCESPTWRFTGINTRVLELVRLGDVHKQQKGRISLMDNCSLLIEGVRKEDAGVYSCLFRSGVKQPPEPVYLSVVTCEYTVKKKEKKSELRLI